MSQIFFLIRFNPVLNHKLNRQFRLFRLNKIKNQTGMHSEVVRKLEGRIPEFWWNLCFLSDKFWIHWALHTALCTVAEQVQSSKTNHSLIQSDTTESTLIIVQIHNSLTSSDRAQSLLQKRLLKVDWTSATVGMCLGSLAEGRKGSRRQLSIQMLNKLILVFSRACPCSSDLCAPLWKSMQTLHQKNCFTQVGCWISRTKSLFSEDYFCHLSVSILPLQCVLADGRGCSSCTSSPGIVWSPSSFLHSQEASRDHFAK